MEIVSGIIAVIFILGKRFLMKKIIVFFVFVSVLLFGQMLQGKVVGVMDGDTIKILAAGNKQFKIRLSDIDAPEKKQAFGNKAKWFLSDLVYRKNVTVQFSKKDRYKRIIGRVYVGNMDVNKELVEQGYAWVYRKYSKDSTLLRLENYARSNRLGLWRNYDAVEPSVFRKNRRNRR